MKREIQVTFNAFVHDTLDGKTIPEAVKALQRLSKYTPRSTKLYLDWTGDRLKLVSTRAETDEEERARVQSAALANLKGDQR